jgi:acetylornithine deacetylase
MKSEASILLDLVAIPSVSALTNRPVIDYVRQRLNPRDWRVRLLPHPDPAFIDKVNLVAITKRPGRPSRAVELALVCHTDTVPFDLAWKDAVAPRIRNGRLYGRGSCDVKGFLACVLTAFAQLDVRRLSKPLALVLTADEEIGCVGARFLARAKALRARYTLIGEPTGLRPVRAGKGYGLAEIVARGKEAHSAFPAVGRNAIYDAGRILARLEHVAKKLTARRDEAFDPPFTTLNVGLIRGGTAKNIIPGECRITLEWRPIPGQDPEWAPNLVREELARLTRSCPGLDARFELQRMDPAFEPSASRDLNALLESLTGRASATVAFGTEAAHLRPLTKEAVVFGPGDMAVAHKSGEYVPVAELSECVAHLRAVIERLCA